MLVEYIDTENMKNIQKRSRKTSEEEKREMKRASSLGWKHQRSISCDASVKRTEKPRKRLNPLTPVSLISYAVVNRDCNLLKKLVQRYPLAVNELSDEGLSPLHLAAIDGNMEIMKILLDFNARVNMLDLRGKLVLEYAVACGQFDAAQLLIEYGSDLSQVRDGFTF